jgi:hypothetical protein
MCRPFGKSSSELRASSKVAGIISRREKGKDVSVMFCVVAPKQVQLTFSEVQYGYIRA